MPLKTSTFSSVLLKLHASGGDGGLSLSKEATLSGGSVLVVLRSSSKIKNGV